MTVIDRFARVALAATALVVGPTAAHAEPSSSERAIAQTAFDDARTLFDRGEYAAACEKFALSRKLDTKLGTIMNLAICLDRIGRIASAYAELGDAESLGRREGRAAVVKDAAARAQALAPRLPRLRLHVDPSVRQLDIDGAHLDPIAWSTDIPLDPGAHTLHAGAAGRISVEIKVAVREASVTTVDVGPLAETPMPASPPATSAATRAPFSPPRASSGRTLGIAIGGAGLAVVAAGAVFGGLAIGRRHDAEEACLASDCGRGASINREASAFAWTSNIAIGVGVAAVVTGVVLWVTSPRSPAAARASGHSLRLGETPDALREFANPRRLGIALSF